jgi:hypothetical protein
MRKCILIGMLVCIFMCSTAMAPSTTYKIRVYNKQKEDIHWAKVKIYDKNNTLLWELNFTENRDTLDVFVRDNCANRVEVTHYSVSGVSAEWSETKEMCDNSIITINSYDVNNKDAPDCKWEAF